MGRRLSATLGFGIGIGAASLLNLDFYSEIGQKAIAAIAVPIGQPATAPTSLAQPFTSATSCATNDNHHTASLRIPHPQSISLLRHVPAVPQRLNWYGISQGNTIANAPKRPKIQPAVTHWNTSPPALFDACRRQITAIAPSGLSLLNQQSHFILSFASLKQKNDWLLQPLPEPPQIIHSIWRGHETIGMNWEPQSIVEMVAKVE